MAYEDFLHQRTGNPFITVPIPKEHTKTYNSCGVVDEWCKEQNLELRFYFRMVNEAYDVAWMKATFKRGYLPFHIAVSEKALLRTQAQWKRPLKSAGDAHLTSIRRVLSVYDGTTKRLILETAGWIDAGTREHLLKEMLQDGHR